MSLFRERRAGTAWLPVEGHLPALDGGTGWLNSPPLAAAELRGRVILVDFWTFSCINWIRTAPYLRAWNARYRERGLIVIGVHTPEFPFETDVDSVTAAIKERELAYPVVVDSDYAIWGAFANKYWPALYIADGDGAMRFHHFGEGRYEECERAIQQLLDGPGAPWTDHVDAEAHGVEAPADWVAMKSPETYLGFERAERFASPDGPAFDRPCSYRVPSPLLRNTWALSGAWTIGGKAARLEEAGGLLAYRFQARDLHLVMGPAEPHRSVPFHIRLDGESPGAAHGVDVDNVGEGIAEDRRLYQLVRQRGPVREHVIEITFHNPGVEAYVFTFG